MKFLLGFIVGVAASFAAYQLDTKREIPPAEEAPQEASEAKTDFTFYDNLFDTSVTVLDGVYDQALSNEEAGEGGAGPAIYFVQLGSFSRKERLTICVQMALGSLLANMASSKRSSASPSS